MKYAFAIIILHHFYWEWIEYEAALFFNDCYSFCHQLSHYKSCTSCIHFYWIRKKIRRKMWNEIKTQRDKNKTCIFIVFALIHMVNVFLFFFLSLSLPPSLSLSLPLNNALRKRSFHQDVIAQKRIGNTLVFFLFVCKISAFMIYFYSSL